RLLDLPRVEVLVAARLLGRVQSGLGLDPRSLSAFALRLRFHRGILGPSIAPARLIVRSREVCARGIPPRFRIFPAFCIACILPSGEPVCVPQKRSFLLW